jgi:hypothetical protein
MSRLGRRFIIFVDFNQGTQGIARPSDKLSSMGDGRETLASICGGMSVPAAGDFVATRCPVSQA